MKTITAPGHILLILRRLKDNGHAAYLVGGCVRDAVMGRSMREWDITTSAAPLDVARLFRDAVMIGAKFGTVTVSIPRFATATTSQKQDDSPKAENGNNRRSEDLASIDEGRFNRDDVDDVQVTTFRTEEEYLDGRHPSRVEFVSTLDEDLSRRDFTINAMACTISGRIIDLFGGIDDINKRIIRCVGDSVTRISEDALRMFRAYRFSAELGFEIEPESLHAIHENAQAACRISPERVREELEKTLISQKPEITGEMIQCGLLDRYLKRHAKSNERHDDSEIQTLRPRSDGAAVNLVTLKSLSKLPPEPLLRWCVFCAIMLDNGLVAATADILRELHIDEKTVRSCTMALSITVFPQNRAAIKRLLAKHGIDAVRCAAAICAAQNDGSALQATDEIIQSGECFTRCKLAISGKDLIQRGIAPGPEIGKTLDEMVKYVIDYPEKNTREILLDML